ncbi:MAG: hypothetical protein K2X47_11655 [Bdellovibrionales bacterium]|nr:hypothetical protein [Bdellovibrionales bacterium]
MAIRGITTFIISATLGFVLITYQNCAQKMNFEANIPAVLPDDNNNGLGTGPSFKEVSSSFRATQNKIFPTIKVVLVVDNSPSMRLIQQKLSQGLQSLADDVFMYDTEFYLYTTSQDIADPKSAVRYEKVCEVLTKDSMNPANLTLAETRTGACPTSPNPGAAANDRKVFREVDRARLSPSLMPLSDFRLRGGSLSRVEFEAFKLRLSNAIQAAGTSGSADELGVCSMVRTIYENNGGPFQVISGPSESQQKDVVVFIAISDEDDQSVVGGQPHGQCFLKKEKVKDCANSRSVNAPGTPSTDPKDAYFAPSYTVTLPPTPRDKKQYLRFTHTTAAHNTVTIKFQKDRPATTSTQSYKANIGVRAQQRFALKAERKPEEQFKFAYQEKTYLNGPSGEIFEWQAREGNPRRYVNACITTASVPCNAEQTQYAQTQVIGTNVNRRLPPAPSCTVVCVGATPVTPDRFTGYTYRADNTAPASPEPAPLSDCNSLIASLPSTDRAVTCEKQYVLGSAPVPVTKNRLNVGYLCPSNGSAGGVGGSLNADQLSYLNSNVGAANFLAALPAPYVESCSNNPKDAAQNDSFTHYPSQCTEDHCANASVISTINSRVTSPWQLVPNSCSFPTGSQAGACYLNPQNVQPNQTKALADSATCTVGEIQCTTAELNQVISERVQNERQSISNCVRVCESQTPIPVSVDTSYQLRIYSANPAAEPTAAMVPANCSTPAASLGLKIIGVKNNVKTEYSSVEDFYSKTNGNRSLVSCALNQAGALQRETVYGLATEYYCTDSPQTTDVFGYKLGGPTPIPDIQDIFRTQAAQLFKDRFLVSSFITKPGDIVPVEGTSKCRDMTSTQMAIVSAGLRYQSLSESTRGGRANSVCDENYGSGLAGVAQWIQDTIDTTYLPPDLPTKGRVEMTAIWIKRPNGTRVDLRMGIDVVVSGNEFRFKDDLVQPDDVIHWTANIWEDAIQKAKK